MPTSDEYDVFTPQANDALIDGFRATERTCPPAPASPTGLRFGRIHRVAGGARAIIVSGLDISPEIGRARRTKYPEPRIY